MMGLKVKNLNLMNQLKKRKWKKQISKVNKHFLQAI
jgi:hypothetical protein